MCQLRSNLHYIQKLSSHKSKIAPVRQKKMKKKTPQCDVISGLIKIIEH